MGISEKILNRVKKLLAMAADGSSPNEAAIAAKRARALMDKHQISEKDIVESDGFGEETGGRRRQAIPKWEQFIAVKCAMLNDCKVTYDYGKWHEDGKTFRFQGFESDVVVARFMYGYLVENGNRLCKRFMKTAEGSGITVTNTFKMGYSRELCDKITEIIEERKSRVVTSTGTSLVVQKTALVEQRFGVAKYGKSRSTRHYGFEYEAAAQAGRAAGRAANITTGVTGKQQERLAR